MESTAIAEGYDVGARKAKSNHYRKEDFYDYLELDNKDKLLQLLKKEMKQAAARLEFERAAELRDTIADLEKQSNS
jgi:excinuclease ABC subunit B